MFSLMLNAETCARLMANNNSEKAKDAMAKVQSLAKDTLVEMRGLIFELRPLILKEQGLVRALESNINVFIKRNGIPVAFSYGMLKRLPEDLELCLYRVAQEALTNIMKHAAASSIEISLDFKPDTVTLTIADDGKGFDIQTVLVSQKNFGLVAMRERIEACGGQLLIDSATGRGTIVKAQISMGGRVCESN
jgi:signal transduction histidine kinase